MLLCGGDTIVHHESDVRVVQRVGSVQLPCDCCLWRQQIVGMERVTVQIATQFDACPFGIDAWVELPSVRADVFRATQSCGNTPEIEQSKAP